MVTVGPLGEHRGPYRLMVTRPYVKKSGFYRSEWLNGEISRDDVEAEALALLSDPRDTINVVYLWSVREECYVTWYRKDSEK